MAEFITKSSGEKEVFTSGYQRDSQETKTRYDLIPVGSLKRVAGIYGRGAKLYGDNNWKNGCPYSRMYASLLRHVLAFREGDTSEDHLAAACWNAMGIMFYQDQIEAGKLPKELNDLS